MAKQGIVEGRDLMMYMKTGTDASPVYTAVAHSTSHTISWSSESRDRKSKDAGVWAEKVVTGMSCQIKCEALVSYDAEVGYAALLEMMKEGKPVLLKFGYTNEDAGDKYEEGEFVISQIDENAPSGEDATFSVTFDNTGAVTTKAFSTSAN